LRDNGVEPEIVEYLNTPYTAAQLKTLLGQLKIPARALLRKKEAAEAGIDPAKLSDEQLIAAMAVVVEQVRAVMAAATVALAIAVVIALVAALIALWEVIAALAGALALEAAAAAGIALLRLLMGRFG